MSRKSSRSVGWTALAVLLCLAVSAAPAGAAAMKLWWDTFEDNNTNMWTFAPMAGVAVVVDNTTANTGTRSLKVTGNSAANQGVQAWSRQFPIDFDYDYTVQFAFKYADFHWDRILVFGHIRLLLDYDHLPLLFDPVGNNSFVGNRLGSNFNTYLPAGTWGWITVHCRPSVRQYTVFVNGTRVGTVTYQVTVVPSTQLFWEDNFSVNNFLTAWFDDFSVWGMQGPLQGDPLGVQYCNPSFMGGADPENTPQWAQPPDVPWHSQFDNTPADPDISAALAEPCSPPRGGQQNGRCMVASLDMIFDRFETLPAANIPPNPQEEISAAANTNDRPNINNATGGPGNWFGTYANDCRRAAHFSSATQALTATRGGCPPFGRPGAPGVAGYTWRSLGYSALDSVWTDLAPDDTVDVMAGTFPWVLETFLASGYPIIIHFPTVPDDYCNHLIADSYEGLKDPNCDPELTVSGHAIVLYGFDNQGHNQGNPLGPAFLVHDPGVGKNLWVPAQYFWDTLWTGKGFVFSAPWELQWLSPPAWSHQCKFDGTLLVTYPGPQPLNGFFPVSNAQGKLTLGMIGYQGGEVAQHNLANIAGMGSWDSSTWKLVVSPKPPCNLPCIFQGTVNYQAWGTLNPAAASHSYANYADQLGGSGGQSKWLSGSCAKLVDGGHAHWPYSKRWWNDGEPGGSSLGITDDPGGSVVEVTAEVRNFGTDPIPAGAVCRFYFDDPTLAERGAGGVYIGEVPVPTLAPEDTLTIGPLLWTRPPENGFGEPHFSLRAELVITGDAGTSTWPQDENNHAVLARFYSEAMPAQPESMHVALVNPETGPMNVLLEVEKEDAAESWSVVLLDPDGDVIPQGVLIPMAGSESLTMGVVVTPTPGDTLGTIHVVSCLYTTGGALVREMGGITWTLHVPSSSADAGPVMTPGSPSLFLAQNTPNPFQKATAIRYSLPRKALVQLQVFDIMGRLVRTLVSGEELDGWHEARWTGTDDRGATLAQGLYFYRLEVDGRARITKKLLFLR